MSLGCIFHWGPEEGAPLCWDVKTGGSAQGPPQLGKDRAPWKSLEPRSGAGHARPSCGMSSNPDQGVDMTAAGRGDKAAAMVVRWVGSPQEQFQARTDQRGQRLWHGRCWVQVARWGQTGGQRRLSVPVAQLGQGCWQGSCGVRAALLGQSRWQGRWLSMYMWWWWSRPHQRVPQRRQSRGLSLQRGSIGGYQLWWYLGVNIRGRTMYRTMRLIKLWSFLKVKIRWARSRCNVRTCWTELLSKHYMTRSNHCLFVVLCSLCLGGYNPKIYTQMFYCGTWFKMDPPNHLIFG